MTRTVSPGGQWTYTRTDVSGNHWQTKVTTPPDPSVGDDTVIDFQKDSASTLTNNFFETQRVSYQGSAPTTPLRTTIACYNAASGTTPTPSTCPTTSVSSPLLRITAFQYVPNTSGVESETDSTYDNFGLIHEVDSYDYGSGAVGPLLQKVLTNYATLGNGIVDRPSGVTTTDGSGSIKAFTSYSYDGTGVTATSGTPQHASISGSRGNLTSAAVDANSSTILYRTFSYYDTGALNASTGASTSSTSPGPTTTYVYGTGSCGNSFPTQVNMPLGLSTSATWNCVGGVQLTSTDVNGNITTRAYTDPNFWRPASTTDPASNVLHYNYYNPAPPPARAETFMFFNANQSISEQLTTVDGFDRTSVVQRQQAPGVSNFDTTETDYDSFGRVYKTYLPYFSTSYGQTNPGGPGVTQTYDALNRPWITTDGGGGTLTNVYSKNDVLQTMGSAPSGEDLKNKQLEYDGLGRLTSVCEISGTAMPLPGAGTCAQTVSKQGYWTKYTYDAMGDLTQVTQNAQSSSPQTRTYTYDMLGRLTSEINPESGTKQYFYDSTPATPGYNCQSTSAGDMIKSYDANTNTMCYYYDSLHRLFQNFAVGPNNASGISNYYVHDSATVDGVVMANSKGQIAETYTATCYNCTKTTDEGFSYDVLGNTTDVYQSTPTSGGYYHSQASYYPNGAINKLTPTGSPTFTYGADGEGRTSLVANSNGQNPVPSPPGVSYDVAGHVTNVPFGSGDSDAYQFDPNTGRMNQYQFKMAASTDTGLLTWNANGSLGSLAITDQINPANTQTCNYVHDDVSRVAAVNCPSAWSQSFTYDPYGNVTKSGSSAWMPGYSNNNRYALAGTSYDANGNLLTDTFHTYAYDADGNVVSLDGNSVVYDAQGRMVQEGSTSLLMGPLGSKPLASMSGQTVNEVFIPLPGGAMMRSGYGYRHGDWLGSVRLLTSFNQTLGYDSAYAPFGENYAGTGPKQDNGFTQGTTDSLGHLLSTDLYDFDFRKYAQAQGRWITPDPAGMAAADPTNPQSWNRYAYVMNSPLSNVDPLGLDYCNPDDPTGCCNPLSDPTECGSYCPPENGYCGGVCNYDPEFCLGTPGAGGNGGGDGGSNPSPAPPAPTPTPAGGVWLNNETLGLPGGLNVHPLSLADFFGLTPGMGCDFGRVCVPMGNNFGLAAAGAGGGIIVCEIAEPCGATADIIAAVGIAVASAFGIDSIKMLAKGGNQNVSDTAVLSEAQEMVEEGIANDICDALDLIYKNTPPGPQRNKVKATQKAQGCRGHS